MIPKYRPLFNLNVKHAYFESGFCEDLLFSGLNNTLELLNKYSLKIFKNKSGFTLYINSDVFNTDFLEYIETVSRISSFEFYASTLNSNFYSYTDMPLSELGMLVFNSDNTSINNDKSLLLKDSFEPRNAVSKLFKLTINFKDIMALDENSNLQYEIQFKSRASQFKYNIITSSNLFFNELSIYSSSDIQFNSGEKVFL